MTSYTRDPSLLFRKQGQRGVVSMLPPPLNNMGSHHCGAQPVQYNQVTLLRGVGAVQRGAPIHRATVDWLTGEVELHDDVAGCLFRGVVRQPSESRYANMFYVREVVDFLARGHSLLQQDCRSASSKHRECLLKTVVKHLKTASRCLHKMDNKRACELGISKCKAATSVGHYDTESWRDGLCKLPSERSARTAEEIAQEIAVTNLLEVQDKTGRRLVDDILANPCIVSLPQDKLPLFAYKPALDGVASKEQLLMAINASPLGMRQPTSREAYNLVEKDTEALASSQAIYRIFNAETKQFVCFPREQHAAPVDEDLKQLWHSFVLDTDSLERQLLLAGLRPMQTLPPAQQPKKAPKRKRSRPNA